MWQESVNSCSRPVHGYMDRHDQGPRLPFRHSRDPLRSLRAAWEVFESDEWYTPAYIFEALGVSFNLDVACPPEGPRHVPAANYFSEGALERDWYGMVWMNPPFGHQNTKRKWLRKFFDHHCGIALLPDRTSAPWWQEFAPLADAVLFVTPKVKFERPDGTIGEQPGTGTTLFACGQPATDALIRATSLGQVFKPVSRIAA